MNAATEFFNRIGRFRPLVAFCTRCRRATLGRSADRANLRADRRKLNGALTNEQCRSALTSTYEKPGDKLYVRLKLLPRSKIPFTTQTFRLADRSLLADIPEGSWVKFTSRRIDGKNTVTAIRVAEECPRFQPCH
ncbi:hypothetical protein [Variovorax sp. DXTD-1]|uniref:hypothetical protein n=1 Tax=Variovorax sp. DXTD-1 TaxID=2495592 RepID=UPI000F86B270|nr:hypothetical protein [Variovorax sp. DXTD-1]RST52506.1 hypothetical protein EJI00_06790 [Variovorax sp. DXTD-1]